MKDLTPKVDSTSGPTGELLAAEFNDMRNDAQNAVTNTGQTLTAAAADDNEQLTKAIAVGGRRISRAGASTALVGDIVLPDNSGGAITINLPAVSGLFVNASVDFEQVIDQLYSVNSLTIGRNSQLIMGLAEDMVVNTTDFDDSKFRMTWIGGGTGWLVVLGDVVGTTL